MPPDGRFRQALRHLQPEKWDADRMHPLQLAYLGDAVFELAVRSSLCASGAGKMKELHRMATERVRAAAQAKMLQNLTERLRPDEAEVVRRARNAKTAVPRSAQVSDYRYSTAFEALLGYLYVRGDWERLAELVQTALAYQDEE